MPRLIASYYSDSRFIQLLPLSFFLQRVPHKLLLILLQVLSKVLRFDCRLCSIFIKEYNTVIVNTLCYCRIFWFYYDLHIFIIANIHLYCNNALFLYCNNISLIVLLSRANSSKVSASPLTLGPFPRLSIASIMTSFGSLIS